jgi:hypothetical protein
MQNAKAGNAVTRIFHETQQRKQVFYMRRFEIFQATELNKRNIAARKLDLQRAAM